MISFVSCFDTNFRIDDHKRRRFTSAYNAPSVRMIQIRGSIFVLINSMALEGDGCSMCAEAEEKIKQISDDLGCAQVSVIYRFTVTRMHLGKYSIYCLQLATAGILSSPVGSFCRIHGIFCNA